MSLKGLKSLLLAAPFFAVLVACSGGAGNGENATSNAKNPNDAQIGDTKQLDLDQRVTKWGQFVGLDSANAKSELTKAGLIEQVGKNAALDETQARAFIELSFAHDATFSQGFADLNQRNGQAFSSFFAASLHERDFPGAQPVLDPNKTPRSLEGKSLELADGLAVANHLANPLKPADSPTFGDNIADPGDQFRQVQEFRQKAVDDYLSMTNQAGTLRQRLLDAAQILGFVLEPATARDLVADSDFTKTRNDFVKPVVASFFASEIVESLLALEQKQKNSKDPIQVASDEQIQFAADPLVDVTFKVGGRFISFYQFNTPPASTAGAPITVTLGSDSSANNHPEAPNIQPRGSFTVISAEENFFLAVKQGGFDGNIKK